MNIKCLVASSAIALISASAAQAADVVLPRESVAAETASVVNPSFSWTGFYLGGQIGNFSSQNKIGLLSGEETNNIDEDLLPHPSGFMGGLYAGSNIEFGNGFVLGVDTDLSWANKSDSKNFLARDIAEGDVNGVSKLLDDAKIGDQKITVAQGQTQIHGFNLKEKWAGATRVRVGFAVDRFLPYVAGGVAYARLDGAQTLSVSEQGTGKVLTSGNLSNNQKSFVGYALGAGVDFAVDNHVILRAEYRYSDFGKKKFEENAYEVSYKTNDFRVGVAYKF
ncbi:outer membrane protein [Bartonella sp. CB189]|uniref:outer membrane protein n=1 Tax=Bartonella sp. CB189 TaxID=3112254 RepID=UPI002F96B597